MELSLTYPARYLPHYTAYMTARLCYTYESALAFFGHRRTRLSHASCMTVLTIGQISKEKVDI